MLRICCFPKAFKLYLSGSDNSSSSIFLSGSPLNEMHSEVFSKATALIVYAQSLGTSPR